MWHLSVEGRCGTWWQTLCVAPREKCVEHAEEHDGGYLGFPQTHAPNVFRAEGLRGIYFLNRALPGDVPTMEPGPIRYPY